MTTNTYAMLLDAADVAAQHADQAAEMAAELKAYKAAEADYAAWAAAQPTLS